MSKASDLIVPGFEQHAGFSVVKATTETLKECAYRLRYRVYVEIMKRTQLYADHSTRIIYEPLDERGAVYLAVFNGKMIGTIRRNLLDDPTTQNYQDLYQARLFDLNPCPSKLMVLPEFQGTRLAAQLIRNYALDQYNDHIELDIIDCNDRLIPFFERLGYFSYIGWVDHREYGRVMPMFLAQDAVRYLKSIRSLLWPIAEAAVHDNAYKGYNFIQRLAQAPSLAELCQASANYRRKVEAIARNSNEMAP